MRKIESAAAEAGRQLELLVQVDLAGEPTKHGAREAGSAGDFRGGARVRRRPAVGPHDAARPPRRIPKAHAPGSASWPASAIGCRPGASTAAMLAELSMGMSQDYEIAVEEGATLVRVGTAIFGGRAVCLTPVVGSADPPISRREQRRA